MYDTIKTTSHVPPLPSMATFTLSIKSGNCTNTKIRSSLGRDSKTLHNFVNLVPWVPLETVAFNPKSDAKTMLVGRTGAWQPGEGQAFWAEEENKGSGQMKHTATNGIPQQMVYRNKWYTAINGIQQ